MEGAVGGTEEVLDGAGERGCHVEGGRQLGHLQEIGEASQRADQHGDVVSALHGQQARGDF